MNDTIFFLPKLNRSSIIHSAIVIIVGYGLNKIHNNDSVHYDEIDLKFDLQVNSVSRYAETNLHIRYVILECVQVLY